MADSSIIDFDSDFVGFWWGNFDCLDGQVFACFPRHRSLCILYQFRCVIFLQGPSGFTNLTGNGLLCSEEVSSGTRRKRGFEAGK
jgi:hypothetical protein